jgi:hypothetical protein
MGQSLNRGLNQPIPVHAFTLNLFKAKLKLSSHQRLGLTSVSFLQVSVKRLYALSLSSMCYMSRPSYPTSSDRLYNKFNDAHSCRSVRVLGLGSHEHLDLGLNPCQGMCI